MSHDARRDEGARSIESLRVFVDSQPTYIIQEHGNM